MFRGQREGHGRRRRARFINAGAAVVGVAGLVGVVTGHAQVITDPLGLIGIGTNGDSSSGYLLAVSTGGGSASSAAGAAVANGGSANGYALALSNNGAAAGYILAVENGNGSATAGYGVAVANSGDAHGGYVAVSDGGTANGWWVGVSNGGPAWGNLFAASNGNSTWNWGLGSVSTTQSSWSCGYSDIAIESSATTVECADGLPAQQTPMAPVIAVSVLGSSSACGNNGIAVSLLGPASTGQIAPCISNNGGILAISGLGAASSGGVAISGGGPASGGTAGVSATQGASGCTAAVSALGGAQACSGGTSAGMNGVTVAGTQVPVPAAAVGGAVVVGTATMAGAGIPVSALGCQVGSWSFQSTAAAAGAIDIMDNAAAEVVSMGFTVSACETAASGSGSITSGSMSAVLTTAGPGFACSFSGGSYTRAGSAVTITVPASCSIGGTAHALVLRFAGTFVPVSASTTAIQQAAIGGTWTASPV